jgi:hypothetical protein
MLNQLMSRNFIGYFIALQNLGLKKIKQLFPSLRPISEQLIKNSGFLARTVDNNAAARLASPRCRTGLRIIHEVFNIPASSPVPADAAAAGLHIADPVGLSSF